jgi:hypothetical protein
LTLETAPRAEGLGVTTGGVEAMSVFLELVRAHPEKIRPAIKMNNANRIRGVNCLPGESSILLWRPGIFSKRLNLRT